MDNETGWTVDVSEGDWWELKFTVVVRSGMGSDCNVLEIVKSNYSNLRFCPSIRLQGQKLGLLLFHMPRQLWV